MVEAILFDFDLTLADSSAAVTECANHALRALGLAAAEPVLVHQTIGLSLVQSFRALSGNDDPRLGAAYAKHFGEHADRVMAELVCLYPGAADTVRDLRGRGLRTAIVSTKFRYRIEDILNRAESSGLVDVIASPVYATGIGLLLYGMKRQERTYFRMRDDRIFSKVKHRMSDWLSEFF